MKINPDQIEELIANVNELIEAINEAEARNQPRIDAVSPTFTKSARNLIHYQAFRKFDLRKTQKRLGELAMSRLSLAEGHVKASLLNTKQILQSLIGDSSSINVKSGLSIKSANKILANHTKELLGYRSKGRRVRIMVTQPTESAYDYDMVLRMVKKGMNTARINCAHDGPEVWLKMIEHIHKASKELGRKVKISMDLAGPKIRTGAIEPGEKVRKFAPERNEIGVVINPGLMVLVEQLNDTSESNAIPVDSEWLSLLEIGDKITLTDTRDKERTLKVIDRQEEQVLVNCYDTTYLATGTTLILHRETKIETTIGELPPIEQALLLRVNDLLTIHKEGLGQPAQYDEEGNLMQKAHISCQLPEVFDKVKIGEAILFDDGKIEGLIVEKHPDSFEVSITRARETGSKLKAEKGINFPTTDMGISGLTEKDKEDLDFVCRHADVVNFSFVNSKEDVEELFEEFERYGVLDKMSVILKIETQRAFDNISEIILAAMRGHYVGVMIARGDLAVETGWNNIGWVQNELLSMCNAAHIPVVWATQVLENLAKKGLPSRSEITDAANSLRAECVMLNKGPFINDAIYLLDRILSDMESFQEKNQVMLPQMSRLLKPQRTNSDRKLPRGLATGLDASFVEN